MVMSGVYYNVTTLQRLVRLLLAYRVSQSRLKTCSHVPRPGMSKHRVVLSGCSSGECCRTVTQLSLMQSRPLPGSQAVCSRSRLRASTLSSSAICDLIFSSVEPCR